LIAAAKEEAVDTEERVAEAIRKLEREQILYIRQLAVRQTPLTIREILNSVTYFGVGPSRGEGQTITRERESQARGDLVGE
jgi:hypothetical protein